MEGKFTVNNKKRISICFTQEEYDKLLGIQQHIDPKDVPAIITDYINEKYELLRKKSLGITVAELLAEKLDTIQKYNSRYNSKVISQSSEELIRLQKPSTAVIGMKKRCIIEDHLVMSYREEFDVLVPHIINSPSIFYNFNSIVVPKKSYLLFISTHVDDYVYVASNNTMTTVEAYKKSLQKYASILEQ